ncbi:hypothetical protein DEU56DRAFT_519548 [Suillus clintonianus]|uniref:uncharacterized protein n=1 Tax=Suillus clintonianus TaxID=1904413 RepID=UPI001B85E321|nr:uncharacterized protein DEU56DRAFT_519548 [Suillus clintonianus]KAG2152863.1 hypothetical protein DEU56DRAFT_519548 [Suillus clintonianus]
MNLSQQELPITSYFARDKKGKKVAEQTKKRKLAPVADDRGGPAKRAAVSADVHTGAQGSAKRPQKTRKQTKLPPSKPLVASTSSRRERPLPRRPSHDVVVIDSSPERPVAGSSRSAKGSSNTVSHRINAPCFSSVKEPVHLASTAKQSLATPPPTNQTKKRTLAVSSTAVVRPLPRSATVAPAVVSLPTPETNVRKPSNMHAPTGLHTFIGATSPCRIKHGSGTHASSSPSPASAPLIMKLTVPVANDLDAHPRKLTDTSHGIRQIIDPDDPFTCAPRNSDVVHATPVSSPDSPFKELQSAPAIVEELIPSSQSQYLLALDATPSRKRVVKPVSISNYEPVPSSQSQEEGAISMASLSGSLLNNLYLARIEADLPTPRPITHAAHFNRSERKRPHQFSLGSSPATSPVVSPPRRFSGSFLAYRSPRNRSSFVASPSRRPLKGTPSRVLDKISPLKKPIERTESMDNVRPAQEDDSVTEPESEPEVLKPGPDDDSETEPESEIPIVALPAEIANCKPQDVTQRPQTTRASIPNQSAKLSPYRKRQTPDPSYTSSLDDLMQQGAGMSVPAPRRCFLLPSRTPPPAVREFLEMFQEGDGSYPDDFPESLRC